MADEIAIPELTEARIRRVLEVQVELLRRTKKDAKKFLRVNRLPNVGMGESVTDVVAPEMAQYFSGLNEDPAAYFRDRERLLLIHRAIRAGGVGAYREIYRDRMNPQWIASVLQQMKAGGLGNAAIAEAALQQGRGTAGQQLRQLESITPSEEQAVRNCLPEIEDLLFGKSSKLRKALSSPTSNKA